MHPDHARIVRALPGYEVGDELGRGAWGVVVQAEHRQLGRSVAVKELPPALADDPEVRSRFRSEARLLASLDHPHIVPIFDYVEDDGLCLLVMELLPGGTVFDRFTTRGVAPEAACVLVLATCSALDYAHGRGILHRDIKPENLMFNATGMLKVTDFGIAKVLGGSRTAATRAGQVLGTPSYIAPEQALAGELSPATDVYAVGTLLYEMLAGTLPFVDDGNPMTLLFRHAHEAPIPLREAAPAVPAPLAEVTMRALATDPGDRFRTAEDLGAALADAATDVWGSGWVDRSGLEVVASGRIGARISASNTAVPLDPWPDQPPDTSPTQDPVAPPTAASATVTSAPGQPAPPPPPAAASATVTSAPGGPAPPTPPAGAPQSATRWTPAGETVRPTPTSPDPGPAPTSPGTARPDAPGSTRRQGPRRWLVAAAVVVVLAAGGIGAAVGLGGSGSPSHPVAAPPSPTTTVSAGPTPVFEDDFADAGSGWVADAGQDGAGTASYVPGGYQLVVLKPQNALNTFSAASPYTTALPSMTASVDLAITTGSPADGAGVRCDVHGRTAVRYTFEVHGDGSWVVFRLGGPGQAALAQGTSPSIRTGSATNTVTGQCTQLPDGTTHLAMTVNGVALAGVTDSPGPGPIAWHAALIAYRSSTSPGTAVRFSHFRTYGG